MMKKIIQNSKLNWIKADNLPERDGNESINVIMLYNDGFIGRGYYDFIEHSWYGYNTFMQAEKYFKDPEYYILL